MKSDTQSQNITGGVSVARAFLRKLSVSLTLTVIIFSGHIASAGAGIKSFHEGGYALFNSVVVIAEAPRSASPAGASSSRSFFIGRRKWRLHIRSHFLCEYAVDMPALGAVRNMKPGVPNI